MGTQPEDIIRRLRRFALILAAVLFPMSFGLLLRSAPVQRWVQINIVDIGVDDGCVCVQCQPGFERSQRIIFARGELEIGLYEHGIRASVGGIAMLVFAALIGPLVRALPAWPTESPHLCENCNYDLAGLPQRGTCPECGIDFIRSAQPPP